MRITMAAAGLAGLLVLTACGSGAEPAATGPATLRMTIWTGNAEHLSLLNSIADEYKKTHQDVAAIKFDTLPIENYTTTLTTQIAGGNAPTWPGSWRTPRPTSSAQAPSRRWTTWSSRSSSRPRRRSCGSRRASSTPTRSPPRPSVSSSTSTC